MSLYDIFGENTEDGSNKEGENRKGVSSGMRMLQSQILAKKSQLSQLQRNIVPPVVDLSSRNRSTPSKTVLRPHKAIPISDGFPLSFIPKALKEDKVYLFGEILVEDEYNPTAPTDFALHKQKIDQRKAKETAAREIAERLHREHQEELAKRSTGAAIAPPQTLVEEDSRIEAGSPPRKSDFDMPPPAFIPSFGGAGKGLGVAANIMTKFGYKEGSGLGRTGQGMSTALKVERMGKNAGIIINEHEQMMKECLPPQNTFVAPGSAVNVAEAVKSSSRILLLQNMVGPDDIDDQLEPEISDEMKKYGQVNKVIIYRLLKANDDEAVRIFVEFTNVAQAIKAFVDLNGRFFGGRSIRASFYDPEAYEENKFDR